MLTNPLHTIRPGVFYIHKLDHRNRSPRKSQWTIPENEERRVFSHAYAQGWYTDTTGWGLRLVNGLVCDVGTSVDQIRHLFIAKFVDGNSKSQWHGYPADHVMNQQDLPDVTLLRTWSTDGYLSFAKVRKIVRRQPCVL